LIYLDVDFFKAVNTKHTETQIDRTLLPAFQTLLQHIVEPYGFIYAEGGDEVVVLLNNCSAYMACALVEEIRATVEETTFQVGLDSVRVTVSIGIAHSGDHASGSDLQLKANEAKNFSKHHGRNRTAIALQNRIEPSQMSRFIQREPRHNALTPARLKELVEEFPDSMQSRRDRPRASIPCLVRVRRGMFRRVGA
jgi:diguanylate cyclase (GGDEF)-like protein